ncbi:MAG: ATP-binding domain-containing protein, partial [Bdellovibrionales bacterium]|nr:ATP-binding domain-containing protein [Bdellovibrionales bacterium]
KALERYPGALTAVICADSAEAKHVLSLLKPSFSHAVRYGDQFNFSFEEGIIVSDPLSVKGLEFTNVLIWNPSIRVYKKDEISRNKLYVSFTRAQDNLSIITWGKPSLLLENIPNTFFRLHIEEKEEETSD